MNLCSLNKRVQAFTLIELMVGMIISGLVLTAIFTAFHIIAKRASVAGESKERTEELSFFYRALSRDFSEADSISVSGNSFQFFPVRAGAEGVTWVFESAYAIRKNKQSADTFNIRVAGPAWGNSGVQDDEAMNDCFRCIVLSGDEAQQVVLIRPVTAADKIRNDD